MSKRAILYRGQFRAVRETLEAWTEHHDEAMEVRDLEEAIRLCRDLDEGTRRMVADIWKDGFSGQIVEAQRLGRLVLRALDESIATWDILAEAVSDYRNRGYSVENGADVKDAIDKLKRLRDDFAGRWPMFTSEELDRGRDQITRGEFVTGEELIRALQGEDRQAG